jgi:hypothetical protein
MFHIHTNLNVLNTLRAPPARLILAYSIVVSTILMMTMTPSKTFQATFMYFFIPRAISLRIISRMNTIVKNYRDKIILMGRFHDNVESRKA